MENLDVFNWYIQPDLTNQKLLLCGDICLTNMRQADYRIEKKAYKDSKYIKKQDDLYKKTNPDKQRFLVFAQSPIVSMHKTDNTATIVYEGHKQSITLQNMDSFFYDNNDRRKAMEDYVKGYRV